MATYATVRKDLIKEKLGIPTKSGNHLTGVTNGGTVAVFLVRSQGDSEEFNTLISWGGKSFRVNSIDLSFFKTRAEAVKG